MKFCTSYFYAIRFFNPNMIPMSTAVSDPKWYHNFKSSKHYFLDKNNVINGLRAEPFVPNSLCQGLCSGAEMCKYKSENCMFLRIYSNQLKTLDKEDILNRFEKLEKHYKETCKVDGEITFALMVHEEPHNLCSERGVIQSWFRDNGIPCEEFKWGEENV